MSKPSVFILESLRDTQISNSGVLSGCSTRESQGSPTPQYCNCPLAIQPHTSLPSREGALLLVHTANALSCQGCTGHSIQASYGVQPQGLHWQEAAGTESRHSDRGQGRPIATLHPDPDLAPPTSCPAPLAASPPPEPLPVPGTEANVWSTALPRGPL